MRSVLIATDLIRKADGTLTPLEINTNSSHELPINHYGVTPSSPVVDFMLNFDQMFNHVEFNTFLQTNGISKITVIDKAGSMGVVFESFTHHYNYQYEFVNVSEGSLTIPNIEDTADTLIIRVSYDSYALIDDIYARDNFEFHNLIKDESFASNVTFNTGEATNLDSIINFEPSVDGIAPNYIVKPRVPGYPRGIYPKLYRLETQEELDQLKASIPSNEFIQKYEYNPTLGRVNNRISFIRSMDLVYGPNLDVINVITYKSINSVSTENTLIHYTSELIEGKRLDPAFALKWHPKHYSLNEGLYHFDESDEILLPDLTTITASQIIKGTPVFGINFDNNLRDLREPVPVETLSTFETGSTNILNVSKNTLDCIFINIKAVDSLNKEYVWFDGIQNKYLIQKAGSSEIEYLSQQSGAIEAGDKIFIFDIADNQAKPLSVTEVFFDIRSLDTYKMTLQPEFREFLTKLEGSVYLIQHNASCVEQCGQFITCGYPGACDLCGKGDFNCPNCTGFYGIGYVCNSDRRLKRDLKIVGRSQSGINIYEFKYLNENQTYSGVIAQELLDTKYKDAVLVDGNGFYKVDYSNLDVPFKKIN